MSVYVGDQLVSGSFEAPVGLVSPFAGTTPPDGWLICDGSAISRVDYADLFAVIGTTYGAGDGSTTFNIPLKHSYTGAVVGNGVPTKWSSNTTDQNLNLSSVELSGSSGSDVVTFSSYTELSRRKPVMLTTDGTKSGIVCEQDANIKMCIKY